MSVVGGAAVGDLVGRLSSGFNRVPSGRRRKQQSDIAKAALVLARACSATSPLSSGCLFAHQACAMRSPRAGGPADRCGLHGFSLARHASPASRHEVLRLAARLIGERTPTLRDGLPGYQAVARA